MQTQQLPFSQACENNKDPILSVLREAFVNQCKVLEIGSGTGQHAVYFAEHLSHLHWQASDQLEYLPGITARISANPRKNLALPIELDVSKDKWPRDFDAAFSANTAHIMPWEVAQLMLKKVAEYLPVNGRFALYGPFNYNGTYTSESNARFDQWLKDVAAHQGIRHFEDVNALLCEAGMRLLEDYTMPANNRLLLWQKM